MESLYLIHVRSSSWVRFILIFISVIVVMCRCFVIVVVVVGKYYQVLSTIVKLLGHGRFCTLNK